MLKWNGKELPDELRQLPEGRYVIEPVDDAPVLTEAEEEGIELALASVRKGSGRRLFVSTDHPPNQAPRDPERP